MPWSPPRTFYEGLACLWFFHEIGGVVDGIGMSVIGTPDRQLIQLYRDDLRTGRLTREEAEELIAAFLVQTDCKLDLDRPIERQANAGEQGDTLILGGVDEFGNEVTNELSCLFLRIHRKLKLIYPKIHCRISSKTPSGFLSECAKDFLAGRNVLSFLNNEVIIPAQCKAGKDKKDAANYVAGGCWEVILDSCEHSEGANCYFSLGKIIDLSIHPDMEEEKQMGLTPRKLDAASSFDEVYRICMDNAKNALQKMIARIVKYGERWSRINPCPLFSAELNGCAESGKDYSAGGAKYSPHGLPLTGLAIFVNSLLAIKKLCFESNTSTLKSLLAAVRDDWTHHEDLRLKAVSSPHWGDGEGEASALAAQVLNELADFIAEFRNERGGSWQCGIYSYVDIVQWAKVTKATPDGRRKGDFLAQRITPTRLHCDNIPAIFRDVAELPLDRFPANSVLTLSLSRTGISRRKLADLIKIWCEMKAGGMLQLNCVNREELEDAVKNPQDHRDLIVRLYGYSAKFVELDPERQQEFISRTIL